MRSMLRQAVGCVLLLAAVPVPTAAEPPAISSTPVALDPTDPNRNALGKAIFRGGVALASEDPFFGGWSDLLVAPDGASLVAIGDQGAWMQATLQYDGAGNLAGVVVTAMGQLKGLDGAELGPDKSLADAEALAPAAEGGYLVAFERQHRIWHYSPDLAAVPVETKEMPLALQGLKPELANNGIEALSRLADGRLIMFLEGEEGSGQTLGFLQGKVTDKPIPYLAQDKFQITGSAPLPDGGLLILERFWSEPTGSLIRLRRLPAAEIGRALLQPLELLLDLRQPLLVDNFEGVGAWQDANGKTRVLLLSDDNFNRGRQQTLLLDFELVQ